MWLNYRRSLIIAGCKHTEAGIRAVANLIKGVRYWLWSGLLFVHLYAADLPVLVVFANGAYL